MMPTSPDGYRYLPGQRRTTSSSRVMLIGTLFMVLAVMGKVLLSDDPAALRSGTTLPMKALLLAMTAVLAAVQILLIRAALRARRARKARALGLPGYWREDHDWADAIHANGGRGAAGLAAAAVLGCSIAASVFAFAAFGSGQPAVGETALAGLAAIMLLFSAPHWHELVLWLRFRDCELAFLEPPPLRPGKPARVRLTLNAKLTAPKAQLRFVQEIGWRFPERRMILEGSASVEESVRADGRTVLHLALSAPAGAPSTRLSEDPPGYWELEAADSQGFEARFLMPVYSIDGA